MTLLRDISNRLLTLAKQRLSQSDYLAFYDEIKTPETFFKWEGRLLKVVVLQSIVYSLDDYLLDLIDMWASKRNAPVIPLSFPPLSLVPPVAAPVPPAVAPPVTHNIKKRKHHLDAEIDLAKTRTLTPGDPTTVWSELIKLAEEKHGSMIGYSSDGIQYKGRKYKATGEPDVFTLKNLRERMERDAKRDKTR